MGRNVDCLQQMTQKHCCHSQCPKSSVSLYCSKSYQSHPEHPCKLKKSGLKCCVVLLQFGKDVINFRSRAKVVQENSVHFWSEIFLRYWIVLGNKAIGSVKCLFLSLAYRAPFHVSLSLPLFPGGQGKHSENFYESSCRVHLDTGFEESKAVLSVAFSLSFKLKSFLRLKGC